MLYCSSQQILITLVRSNLPSSSEGRMALVFPRRKLDLKQSMEELVRRKHLSVLFLRLLSHKQNSEQVPGKVFPCNIQIIIQCKIFFIQKPCESAEASFSFTTCSSNVIFGLFVLSSLKTELLQSPFRMPALSSTRYFILHFQCSFRFSKSAQTPDKYFTIYFP